MADEWSLDEVLDCNIERCTQSAMFMNAFAARTFSTSRFTGPVAILVSARLYKTTYNWRSTTKVLALLKPSSVNVSHLPLPPSPSSDETDRKKHGRNKKKSKAMKKMDQGKPTSPYSTISAERDTQTTVSRHNSFIPDPPGSPTTK